MKLHKTILDTVVVGLLTSAFGWAGETPSAAVRKDSTKTDSLPVYQMDELVVTANRYERTAFEVPFSVSVLSEQWFRSSGAFTISGSMNGL